MALYEIREHDKSKTANVVHDKVEAIAWADNQTKETGKIFEVYEVKQVHLTSKINEMVLDFF